MKITLFIYEKVRGALIGGARSEFLCFHNQALDCVANLYLLPTQYCICIRWRMMKVPGCGVAGQKLILALFDHFIFTSQARILSERTQWTRAITHFIHSAFTSLLGIYMESGNWFEMIWTETSSDGEHPGLSLSSFLIIKCKSLAAVSEVFNFMECFIEASDRANMDTGGRWLQQWHHQRYLEALCQSNDCLKMYNWIQYHLIVLISC